MRLALGAFLVFGGMAWPTLAQASDDDCIHTVKAGQTLGHIANRHGVSQRDLINSNRALKKNPDMLRVGQELDVCAARAKAVARDEAKQAKADASTPPAKKKKRAQKCGSNGEIIEHEIAKGDTLSKLMSRYDVSEREIFRRNPALAEPPHMLRVGQKVKLCLDQRKARASKLCGFRTPTFEHEVVPGENLGQVAGRYGVRRRDLERWNAKIRKNPNLLRVGQKVRVCPEIAPRVRKQITYEVQSGDNLGTIAKKYQLTSSELVRYQRGKLADPSSLRVGQNLVVWVDGGVVEGFGAIDGDEGVLKAGIQLPPGRNYTLKWATGSWGTADSIRTIQTAIANYKKRVPKSPKVHIGDISKRGGGPFKPHSSHQHGRDIDIAYVLKGKHADDPRFHRATEENFDVAKNWRLLKSFIDTDQVVYIFVDHKLQKLLYEHAKKRGASEEMLDELFQYPRGKRRSHGIIRHWKGHINHFHVRFRK